VRRRARLSRIGARLTPRLDARERFATIPPVSKAAFPTPQDCETAFYEALERADLEAMMDVWCEDEEIVCVHPGGQRLTGYDQVRESWAQIFAGKHRLSVHLSNQVHMHGMMLAIHSLHENILVQGEPQPRTPVVCTNVYMRTASGWRLLMHHASPAPALQPVRAAESPKILH
jgi:ketosteroid isomerase-like protein